MLHGQHAAAGPVDEGAALSIGALLRPSLLLLPGLAAGLAGPASILAWIGLLALSGLLARVFTGLGTLIPSGGGVAAYAEAGLGTRAGRAVGWCFLAGVVFGAPVFCLIGGTYMAALLGVAAPPAWLRPDSCCSSWWPSVRCRDTGRRDLR